MNLSYELIEALSVELPAHGTNASFSGLPLLQARVEHLL